MIVVPSGSGLASRFHIPSVDAVDEQVEDDIHMCGACKKQFTDIFLFMRHKSENNCSSRPGKKSSTTVTVPTSLLTAANSSSFNSLGTSICTLNPETKFSKVELLDAGSLSIQKDDVPKNSDPSACEVTLQSTSTSHPPHLILADLASQRLDLQNQDESPASDKAIDGEISLDDDWVSSWSAAKVLGTFSLSNSLKTLQNHSLSTLKENNEKHSNIEVLISASNIREDKDTNKGNLQKCAESSLLPVSNRKPMAGQIHVIEDSQTPERFIGPQGGFLDIEDVEVATLLANHLANEPSLQIYPNAPETFLSYSSLQNQLDIPETSDTMSFVTGAERILVKTQNVSEMPTKAPPTESAPTQVIKNLSTKESLKEKSSKPARKPPKRTIFKCRHTGCTFQGASRRDLTRHLRKHTGEKPYKCPECDKAFTRPDKLQIHLKVHGEIIKPFKCHFCDFSSRERGGLTVHIRKHTDERPFKCQICGHRSRTNSHLTIHLRKHTGDHPYVCKVCGRSYTTCSDLSRHAKVHKGEKPLSCDQCTYSTPYKAYLNTHIEQNHATGESLVCPICNMLCQTRMDLRNHVKSHKDNPKYCSKCDFVCSTNSALNRHIKLHSQNKVTESPLLSDKKVTLGVQRNLKRKSPKKIKKAAVDLPDVYNCSYCSESFWREDALEDHIQEHHLEGLVSSRDPAPQDPVLADSADSRDSTDSNSMDVTCGLAGLAALASYHSASENGSSDQQPAFLYKYISGSQGSNGESNDDDDLRSAEILASLNQGSGTLPQYVTIQTDQNNLVDALNCIQYVLHSPLGTLDDNDNDTASSLLC